MLGICIASPCLGQVAPPAADGPVWYDPAPLETCLTLRKPVEDRSGCIGLATALCLGEQAVIEPARATACRTSEIEQWTARLDAALALLRDSAARLDATEDAAAGTDSASALESAHSTWTAWTEAECAWRRRLEGGSEIAASDCRLRQTAMRALDLELLLAVGEGP